MSTPRNEPPHATGYLFLFRNFHWADGLSEGEIRQAMGKMGAWLEQLSATGRLVSGQPLMEESAFISGKEGAMVTDGPFTEAKEVIAGFLLVSAASMEEAVAIAKTNPLHVYGQTTEVRVTASGCPHLYRLLNQSEETAA